MGRRFAMLIAIALGPSACRSEIVTSEIDRLPRALTIAERAVIRSSNAFGFELFQRVVSGEDGPNVFLSPLSASMALGMTMNGSAAETWEAMRLALHFGGLTETEINDSYHGLFDLLLGLDPLVDVRLANSVWSQRGFPFQPSFFTTVRDYFEGEARELDFADPAAVDVINQWASDATNGRIDKVLERIAPEHIMFLLNALYFKGTWERKFDAPETSAAPFIRADGSQVSVPMMRLPEGPILSTTTPQFQAVELAYGGKAFAMIVLLPADGHDLSSIVASMDDDAWAALVASLDSTSLEVRMPRFRIEYEELLNTPLIGMGMGIAFSGAANFTRLTPVPGVCIHFVKQNTFLEINEEGTEAAAVTTVGIGRVSLPVPFVVDRPFLVAIRERLSGTILFLGTIGDPTAAESAPANQPGQVCALE
jgi:serpin B